MVKQTVFNTIHTIPINGIKHVLCKHARNVLSCTRATDVQAVLSLVVWVATPSRATTLPLGTTDVVAVWLATGTFFLLLFNSMILK